MDKVVVEVFSTGGNGQVIRAEGRKFPGILLQGDTLYSILETLKNCEGLLREGKASEALEESEGLIEQLSEYLDFYEKALTKHQIRLPYNKS